MRTSASHGGLSVRALAGNHATFLGFDLSDAARAGCLGFALRRTDHTENESYWISSFKTFRSVVPNPSSNIDYRTDQHPIQSMWWGDYTAKPKHSYSYRVVPVYGTPAAPEVDDGNGVGFDIDTGDPTTGTHGVYFNRGVAASQAYATKFGAKPDDLPPDKRAAAMIWLSRGLHEAMVGFITGDLSDRVVIRSAAYEFTEPSVLAAFKQAAEAGADVKIVFHDKPKDDQSALNESAIATAGLPAALVIGRQHAPIAHNKFIVRGTRAADGTVTAEQVWTGSTNMSQGGIFGHSNVGHIVRDPAVAAAYLAYWTELSTDPAASPMKQWVNENSPFDEADSPPPGIRTAFSPRTALTPMDWYAAEFTNPDTATHITLPFGLESHQFEPAIAALATPGPLRFVMLNKRDDHQAVWGANKDIQISIGATGGPDVLSRWAQETLTGFNGFVEFLHTKILLVGALGDAPLVVSGSANFSDASTTANDENMLIISGDSEVADVYFTEYMRIYQHFYSRYWAKQLSARTGNQDDSAGFLIEDDSWQKPYWDAASPKSAQRKLYSAAPAPLNGPG